MKLLYGILLIHVRPKGCETEQVATGSQLKGKIWGAAASRRAQKCGPLWWLKRCPKPCLPAPHMMWAMSQAASQTFVQVHLRRTHSSSSNGPGTSELPRWIQVGTKVAPPHHPVASSCSSRPPRPGSTNLPASRTSGQLTDPSRICAWSSHSPWRQGPQRIGKKFGSGLR